MGRPRSSPHSHVVLVGLVTTTSVLCSPSVPSLSRGSPGSCVRGCWPDAALASSPCPAAIPVGTDRKNPRPGRCRVPTACAARCFHSGSDGSPRRMGDCLLQGCVRVPAYAGAEVWFRVGLQFSSCKEIGLGSSGSEQGSVCPGSCPSLVAVRSTAPALAPASSELSFCMWAQG